MYRWCKPCQLLGPRIESVIDEKKGEVLLAKVDIDENSDIALDYEVHSYKNIDFNLTYDI